MCSKQLLLRKTACRTGLSEHCRISGTAAKNDNKDDVDLSYLSDSREIDYFSSVLIERDKKKEMRHTQLDLRPSGHALT